MKLFRVQRPLIGYALCFDDVMYTYLQNKGIPYFHAFGACWEFEYHEETENMAYAVKFPSGGFGKYDSIGVHAIKREITDKAVAWEGLKVLLVKENAIPVHLDGYYCRWDPMLKTKRWHNHHIVLARKMFGKHIIADDPYFSARNQKISRDIFEKASAFYYLIDTEHYEKCSLEERFQTFRSKFEDAAPIAHMERFLCDLKSRTRHRVSDWLFAQRWNLMIADGYMSRYFLWMFFRELYSETNRLQYGILEWLFFGALQLWSECLTHSLKGARRKNKRGSLNSFIETFQAVIEKEKEIFATIIRAKNKKPFEVVKPRRLCKIKSYLMIDLKQGMNARSCKRRIADKKTADLTGEGEYLIPFQRYFSSVKFRGIGFSVRLGEETDNVRCAGQEIIFPNGVKGKGLALLVCTEWGSTQFAFKICGANRDYGAECVVQDITEKGAGSVRIGKSYLSGDARGKPFQKKVYFQCLCFAFSQSDIVSKIILPVCSSVHIFSAVLLQ